MKRDRRDRPTKIVIRYFALKYKDAFFPMYEEDGRLRGSYGGKGYDRDTALVLARAMAEEEGAKFLGDYAVTVRAAGDDYAHAALARDERHWRKVRGR
jgi:hypothetical protein